MGVIGGPEIHSAPYFLRCQTNPTDRIAALDHGMAWWQPSVWTGSGFCNKVTLAGGWRISELQGFLSSMRAPSQQMGPGVLIYDGGTGPQASTIQIGIILHSTIKPSRVQPSQKIYILLLDYGHSRRVAAGRRK